MLNDRLIESAAAFKKESRSDFEKAVEALIALAFRFKYLGADFLWTSDPVLEREANAILRGLSDTLSQKAKARALALMREEGWDFGEDAWEDVNERVDTPILTRFDQQGSFLRELLEIWVALAFVENITPAYLKILVINHLANPYASRFWKGLPAGLLKHGKGYQRDLLNQIGLIGQDGIIGSVRMGEWMDAFGKGATYWIWRRGSNYDCPECEANKGRVFPMDVPFDTLHARCMCWAEYHFEPMEI